MGSGNLLGAGSRFGPRVYKPADDQVEKQKYKKNKEVEAEMMSDVKIETALKIKKLLLLGKRIRIVPIIVLIDAEEVFLFVQL